MATPRSAPASETTVLGSLLLQPEILPHVREILRDKRDLFEKGNQVIYGAILRLADRGDPVLYDTVIADLRAAGELEDAGGVARISEIFDYVPAASRESAEFHARQVRTLALQRRAAGLGVLIEKNPDLDGYRQEMAEVDAELRALGSPRRRSRFQPYSDVEMEELPTPEQIIDDFIMAATLVILYGPPGAGKSFLALAWALSLATGVPWCGRSVKRGPVLYVAAEGSAGLGARIRAWKTLNHFTGPAGVHFVTVPVSLMDPAEVGRFIAEVVEALPSPPVMVVFDTIARTMIGGDENSTRDMSAYIAGADRVREQFGCAVLLLHHTNAAGERERGNSALRGAADTMMLLEAEGESLKLSCTKQKDAAPFPKLHLRLVPTPNSAAILPADGAPQYLTGDLTEKQDEVLALLRSHFLDEGATASEWLKASGMPERTFYDARTVLVRRGYVDAPAKRYGGRYTLTDEGAARVTAGCGTTAEPLRRSNPELLRAEGGGIGTPLRRSNGLGEVFEEEAPDEAA